MCPVFNVVDYIVGRTGNLNSLCDLLLFPYLHTLIIFCYNWTADLRI